MTHSPAGEPELVHRAAEMLAAEWWPGSVPQFVRAFSNHVYLLPAEPDRCYLRITSRAHRSELQLSSELQFVQFLASRGLSSRGLSSRGLSVSEPIPSRSGRLVHALELDERSFFASVFREAPGAAFPELSPEARRKFFRLAGRAMGRLHLEGRDFARPETFRRFDWEEDRWAAFSAHVPESESEAWRLYRELHAWTRELSQDPALFGLIHGDFTILNMRVQGDRLTIFDFDSCCEHWYGYEIATFLHYFGGWEKERRSEVYQSVLDGYREVAWLDPRTLAAIPIFGKMRLLYSFLVFAETWGFRDLSPEQEEYFALRRRLFSEASPWPEGPNDR